MNANSANAVPAIPALDTSRFIDIDLFSPAFKADPFPWFRQWAARPPFYVMVHGRPNAVICRHEQVKGAMVDYETFSVVPQPGWGAEGFDWLNGLPIIAEYDPPEHTRLRRLMQPALTPRRVTQMQDGIAKLIDEMIESVAAKGEFDLMADFAHPLAARLLLGIFLELPEADWVVFTNFSHAMELVATVPPGAPKPQAYMDAFNAAYKYCEGIIIQRRREPKDDLVGSIIAAEEGGAITTEELFATLMALYSAGLGTMAGSLGLSVLRLCRHPDQLKLLQDDPELIHSTIEECLRIESIGNFRHRYVVKDCVIDGVPIYRGMIAHLSMGASNYDPEFYPDPEKFDIRRAPRDISTFGHGAHFCVGQGLARPYLRETVARLVRRFPKIRLADPKAEIPFGGMSTEHMPVSIRLRVD